jgi:serine phosphatase RsbU (regulator of sigma subunit)
LREELLELDAEAAFVGVENDRVVAILVLGGKLSEDSYMEEDASFLGVLAVQMGVVVTRLRQSRQLTELAVAQRIQTELLPDNISVPGLDLAACMIPASEMGGDFYDLYVSERTHWLMLGDVTGHGVASAMVTFMAQSMLTTLLHQAPDQSPEDLLYDLNTVLSDNMTRLAHVLPIALTVLSTVDGRHFRYAGYHDDMIVIRASGDLQRLSVNQAPFSLGISAFPREMYGCASLFLSPGDLLFIATDGIVESVESGSDEAVFGEERLTDLLQSVAHLSAEAIKSAVLAQLEAFRGKTYLDDVTFWVVKVM